MEEMEERAVGREEAHAGAEREAVRLRADALRRDVAGDYVGGLNDGIRAVFAEHGLEWVAGLRYDGEQLDGDGVAMGWQFTDIDPTRPACGASFVVLHGKDVVERWGEVRARFATAAADIEKPQGESRRFPA